MFVILRWNVRKEIAVVALKDGGPRLFTSGAEAVEYATRNLNFHWQIINLEG